MMIMLVMILIFCRRKKYLGWQNLHQSLASQLPHQRVLASILNSTIVCKIRKIYDFYQFWVWGGCIIWIIWHLHVSCEFYRHWCKYLDLPLQNAATLQINENINHEDAKTNVENISKIFKHKLRIFENIDRGDFMTFRIMMMTLGIMMI